MEKYFKSRKKHIEQNLPNIGDGASNLTLLYEAYNEVDPRDDGTIKAGFNELYQLMSGMPLREMDKIIYPVCALCRDHQRAGFVEGVKPGIRLEQELNT